MIPTTAGPKLIAQALTLTLQRIDDPKQYIPAAYADNTVGRISRREFTHQEARRADTLRALLRATT